MMLVAMIEVNGVRGGKGILVPDDGGNDPAAREFVLHELSVEIGERLDPFRAGSDWFVYVNKNLVSVLSDRVKDGGVVRRVLGRLVLESAGVEPVLRDAVYVRGFGDDVVFSGDLTVSDATGLLDKDGGEG